MQTFETWAGKNIIIPDGPRKGQPFKILREPWREIAKAITSPRFEQVTIRASVQSGKTALLIAAALFFMAMGKSVLFFEPNDNLKRRMQKRIRDWGMSSPNEEIVRAWTPMRSPFYRVHENGGSLEIIGGQEHGAGLARTAEIVLVDELRAFTSDLLQEINDRMVAFGGAGRLITASSAGYQDQCRTTAELAKSDSRQWFLKCPNCGWESIAAWEGFHFKKGPPRYCMPCCRTILNTRQLGGAVAAGRWKATTKATVPKTRGYHLDCFSGSAFETLDTIHRAWTRATEHRKTTGSLKEIIDFQMGRRALPFNPVQNSGVSPDAIMQTCRRDYDARIVPGWASVVTVAVDTQDDRLEAEVAAWGALKVASAAESTELAGWSDSQFRGISWRGDYYQLKRAGLSYDRLYGDPGTPDVWERLAELCEAPLPHETGPVMRPAVVGIDSGGHHSNDVAEFVKSRGGGYQALKGLGQHRHEGVIARRSTTIDALEAYGPAGLLLVSTNSAKASIFSMLRQSVAGDDPHLIWPLNEDHYGPEEYAGVCSEILTRQLNKQTGQTQQVWKKVGRYNEALDLLTYSLALVHHVGIGFLISQAEAIVRAGEQEKAA